MRSKKLVNKGATLLVGKELNKALQRGERVLIFGGNESCKVCGTTSRAEKLYPMFPVTDDWHCLKHIPWDE